MIGVYSYGEPIDPNTPYDLFYTLNLPVSPWKKDLDLQSDIVDKIDWHRPYRNWLVDTEDYISKEFHEFCYSIGLKLTTKQLFFACKEGYKGFRHRDVHIYPHWHWGNPYNCAALNFLLTPTAGCLDFLDVREGGEILDTECNTQYEVGVDHDHTKIITSWTGQDNLSPTLVRTEAAHQASNLQGPGPRVTFTVRFHLNPIWWMVRAAFEPYFIRGY